MVDDGLSSSIDGGSDEEEEGGVGDDDDESMLFLRMPLVGARQAGSEVFGGWYGKVKGQGGEIRVSRREMEEAESERLEAATKRCAFGTRYFRLPPKHAPT